MQRIARPLAAIALVALLMGACTGDDNGGGGGGGKPSATGGGGTAGTGPGGETSLQPVGVTAASNTTATYQYVNAGLKVVMSLQGEAGTMEVDNGTDHEVGKPTFYLLDAMTGKRSDGKVTGGAGVDAGGDRTFDVSLAGTKIDQIGLMVLVLGKDNYGAFVRTA